MSGRILLTGGTGTTGTLLARYLRDRGATIRIASRRPSPDQVRFDWADPATHPEALRDVQRVYLIAPMSAPDPLSLVEPFIRTALAGGVRRVVLLSSSAVPEGAPGLGELHRLVAGAVPEWTVLRPSWFMQNFTGDHPVAHGIRADGRIVTATGEGRVAFVDAADIAAVAAHALLDGEPHNTAHVITGPAALGYADAAAIVSRLAGRPVRHVPVGVAEMTARITGAGVPPAFAAALAAMDAGIRDGAEDRVTGTVRRVTGRPPTGFESFAAANRSAWTGRGAGAPRRPDEPSGR